MVLREYITQVVAGKFALGESRQQPAVPECVLALELAQRSQLGLDGPAAQCGRRDVALRGMCVDGRHECASLGALALVEPATGRTAAASNVAGLPLRAAISYTLIVMPRKPLQRCRG